MTKSGLARIKKHWRKAAFVGAGIAGVVAGVWLASKISESEHKQYEKLRDKLHPGHSYIARV